MKIIEKTKKKIEELNEEKIPVWVSLGGSIVGMGVVIFACNKLLNDKNKEVHEIFTNYLDKGVELEKMRTELKILDSENSTLKSLVSKAIMSNKE